MKHNGGKSFQVTVTKVPTLSSRGDGAGARHRWDETGVLTMVHPSPWSR
jgi:hypothetical protein